MHLYLSFANDRSDHLALLKAEAKALQTALFPLEKKDYINVKVEHDLKTDELIQYLMNFPDEIGIFHYAGHANGAQLHLEDGAANAKGIAKLLGEQKNLKLVFLNGCSTKAQVKLLFEAGVKAVIATSNPINDSKAQVFAAAFYEALANRRTIRRAFELAKAALDAKFKHTPDTKITRGIAADEEATEGGDLQLWQLYIQEGLEDEIGDFMLPTYKKADISWVGELVANMSANKSLALVLGEMCNHNPDIFHQMSEMKKGMAVQKDSSTYLDLVIQNFPFVIGSQIQLLRQKTENNRERLDQLVSAFIVTGQTLYYILLSDFWQQKDRLKFKITANNDWITQPDSVQNFLFFDKIIALFDLFPQKDNLFVPEFCTLIGSLRDVNAPAYKAVKFLEILRGGKTADEAIAATCDKAERALTVVLNAAAFLANYQMLTIRNIELNSPRAKKVNYELQMARLNAIVHTSLSFYNDDIYRRKAHYTNSDSVVLISNNELLNQEEALSFYLNLSPFIIDKNTFLNQPHIDLYLFAFEDKLAEKERYHFWSVRHNLFVSLANEKGTDIVHTAMTAGDFKEGRNITAQTKEENDDFGFDALFGTTVNKVESAADKRLVFMDLEEQFEQFKTELLQ